MSGPGIAAGARVADAGHARRRRADRRCALLGCADAEVDDIDGIDLSPALAGGTLPRRASSTPSRSRRSSSSAGRRCGRCARARGRSIAAPKPELFDVEHDPGEQTNLRRLAADGRAAARRRASSRYTARRAADERRGQRARLRERLRALGYSSGSPIRTRNPQSAMARPDPKDRRELAARIAQVTSGELSGAALLSALEGIVRDDPAQRPGAPASRLRAAAGRRLRARRAGVSAAAIGGLPSADVHLGLATCLGRRNDLAGAERALERGAPDSSRTTRSVAANLGILRPRKATRRRHPVADRGARRRSGPSRGAIQPGAGLRARPAGAPRRPRRRATCWRGLPPNAPQRPEVERLLAARPVDTSDPLSGLHSATIQVSRILASATAGSAPTIPHVNRGSCAEPNGVSSGVPIADTDRYRSAF